MKIKPQARDALWVAAATVPSIVVLAAASGLNGARRVLILAAAVLALFAVVVGWWLRCRLLSERLVSAAGSIRVLRADAVGPAGGDTGATAVATLEGEIEALAEVLKERKRQNDEAEHQRDRDSTQDLLTGTYTRQHAIAEIEANLAERSAPLSIIRVDLDDFRALNETWGHDTGDEVLVSVANRLRRLVGADATVARWAGEEFMIIAVGVGRSDAVSLADSVRSLVARPIESASGARTITASVGMAIAEAGSETTTDDLLIEADGRAAAEKEARRAARAIDPETARLVESAFDEERLEVWFQPVVEIQSPTATRIVGGEALIRIRADDGSLRVPGDFFAQIAASEWARRLDLKVAEIVIGHLARWSASAVVPDDFIVSINLSPASLRYLDLCGSLAEVCDVNAVERASVVLELSEEAGELDQIIATDLRRNGFRLSVDDLGLKRSNFDRLFNVGAEFAKVHRRWLDDEIMLDALVGICRGKGLTVVAEGVETMDQLAMLHDKGVELCQGYLISHPVDAVTFEGLLTSGRETLD